ncbi:hypothetical protein V6N11_017782 [Hibiscus sabdariffa]|uniref:Uncharacterized protein n=1 Tax=Hibiscus sabdariffa TaxID=183260 RepID=A0ABR2TZ85_9ROSI
MLASSASSFGVSFSSGGGAMACPLVIWWLLCSVFWLFDGLLAPVCSDHVLGTEVLLATAWLALRFAWPSCWVGYLAIDGLMAGAADARCASRGETVPPLASLNVAALAERFNFFRPVAVVDVAAGRLAWRPSLFFSWCASMLLSMFCSLCFRVIGVLAVVFLCFVRLGAVPSHWSVSRSVVAAIRAEWSKSPLVCPLLVFGLSPWLALVAARIVADQWLWARHCPHGPAPLLALFQDISWPDLADGGVLGLLAVAEGAPLPAIFALLGLGVPAPCVRAVSLAWTSYRGFALMALDGCSCGGCSMAGCVALPSCPCLAAWMLLDRIAFSARPHGRLISCFTSYLH